MGGLYKEYIRSIKVLPPPEGLESRIITRIRRASILKARIRLALSSCGTVIAGALVLPAYSYTASELAESGFGSYASLILSDGAMLTAFWKEFGLTLLESFPILGVTMLCAAVLLSLSMLRLATKNFSVAIIHRQFA